MSTGTKGHSLSRLAPWMIAEPRRSDFRLLMFCDAHKGVESRLRVAGPRCCNTGVGGETVK